MNGIPSERGHPSPERNQIYDSSMLEFARFWCDTRRRIRDPSQSAADTHSARIIRSALSPTTAVMAHFFALAITHMCLVCTNKGPLGAEATRLSNAVPFTSSAAAFVLFLMYVLNRRRTTRVLVCGHVVVVVWPGCGSSVVVPRSVEMRGAGRVTHKQSYRCQGFVCGILCHPLIPLVLQ